jgi:ubiquinone/menaquinone biosynthesis C-methylase UbiE
MSSGGDDAAIERFSQRAATYDDKVSPTLATVVAAVRAQDWFARGPPPGARREQFRAMELGCGTGQLSFALADDLEHCTGVDPARGMYAELASCSLTLCDTEHFSHFVTHDVRPH